MLREAEEVADLQHDKVPGGEHVVEIVLVDPEQDRGHSPEYISTVMTWWCIHQVQGKSLASKQT